jgi:nicotinate dehydrogenase subunit B
MLHARIIRPPAIGANLLDVDASSLAGISEAQVVRIRDFLAVATPREWDAVRAMRALKATWSDTANLSGSDAVFEVVRTTPVARTETLRSVVGDAAAALDAAPHVSRASYAWPIQSHASMGPSCAVADIRDGGGTVWTASQGTHQLRRTIARLLGLDAAKLRLIYMDGSGSYGTNGNDDVAFEAALLSRELRRPMRVQWMREDEHGWDPKGPPQLLDLRATLGADGDIAAWETVAMVPANTPNQPNIPLLASVAAGLDDGARLFSGLLSLNADPPYTVANMRAEIRWQATKETRVATTLLSLALITSSMRPFPPYCEDIGIMLLLRLAMMKIEPMMMRKTISMPKARARILFVLSRPLPRCRKKTRWMPICAKASTINPTGMPGGQSKLVCDTMKEAIVATMASVSPAVYDR